MRPSSQDSGLKLNEGGGGIISPVGQGLAESVPNYSSDGFDKVESTFVPLSPEERISNASDNFKTMQQLITPLSTQQAEIHRQLLEAREELVLRTPPVPQQIQYTIIDKREKTTDPVKLRAVSPAHGDAPGAGGPLVELYRIRIAPAL